VTIKGYDAGKLAAEALLVGEADISTTADVAFVGKSFDNPDIRILGAIDQGFLHEIVARKDKGITNPADLAGKKIGITKGTTGEFFLRIFLTFNGLSLKDVEVVGLEPSEIVDAINKGEIDAGSTWNPFVHQIKQNFGDEVVRWESQCGQPMYFILLTKEKWLNENKETAERFIRSLIQAEEFIKQNNIEARDIITQELGFESSYHNAIWKNYELSITFSQALLIAMEDQARWRINNRLTDATEIPNYLDYIYLDALEEVNRSQNAQGS